MVCMARIGMDVRWAPGPKMPIAEETALLHEGLERVCRAAGQNLDCQPTSTFHSFFHPDRHTAQTPSHPPAFPPSRHRAQRLTKKRQDLNHPRERVDTLPLTAVLRRTHLHSPKAAVGGGADTST